jgi:hypothetical protein
MKPNKNTIITKTSKALKEINIKFLQTNINSQIDRACVEQLFAGTPHIVREG